MNQLPILIVEDDQDLREALTDTLKLAGYHVISAQDGEAALALMAQQAVGLVVSDVMMQPMDGHTLLKRIKAVYPHVPVLLMTAYGMIEKAVEAMRDGACDYLTKPFDANKLLAQVARYMLTTYYDAGGEVIAQDALSRELLSLAQRVAASSTTVMIGGESGSGKEVMARFLHRHSPRADQAFVAINCAAIPDNLLESTLFGYEKGAFTGAQSAQAGKFEQANGGTILLDEISEMPLALQAKLLRVLQEREVERVGGKKPIPLDVRVIATSNRDMEKAVAEGHFREDLYYRLNVFPLRIAPLRERVQDIVPLARHLIGRLGTTTGRHGLSLSKQAEERLTRYTWPGNIRELENVIQRAMILAPGNVIEVEHLHLPEAAKIAAPAVQALAETSRPQDMKSFERAHILDTLAAVKGSRKQAAEQLGMSERTLRYKLQRLREEGIDPDAGR
ncbi:MAG: sigma-54-dependent Fis family transcriptional regulator [Betaproteobacteria bacterium RBG_16_58_11]|nr:MAG: sigma-54-dependent Fis family transcriptional regulator [Betaproteobacteria bacterium RBG_16_58_11]